MKLSHLFIAAVLIVGIGYFVFNLNDRSFQGKNKEELAEVLPDLDLSNVGSIKIQSPEDSVTLVDSNGQWTVQERNGFSANFEEVGKLARTFDELKVLTKEEVGPSQFGRLKLLEPTGDSKDEAGLDVAFFDKQGKELSRIRIGKGVERANNDSQPAQNPMGMGGAESNNAGKFVQRVSDKSVFLVTESFDSLNSDPSSWINKSDFFKVARPSKVSVQSENEDMNWSLSRASENDSWTLADLKEDEKMSSSAVNVLNSYLSFASFNDVSTDKEALKNTQTITIETFEGFKYTIQVGEKTEDGYFPMAVNVSGEFQSERKSEEGESKEDKKSKDEAFSAELKTKKEKLEKEQKTHGHVYLVNTWTLDPALKKREEFLEKPEEAEKPEGDLSTADQDGVPASLLRPEGIEYPEIPGIQPQTANELIKNSIDNAVKATKDKITIPEVNATKEEVVEEAEGIKKTLDEKLEKVKAASEDAVEKADQTKKSLDEKAGQSTEDIEKVVKSLEKSVQDEVITENVKKAVEKVLNDNNDSDESDSSDKK